MAEKHFYEQRTFAEQYLMPHLKNHIPDFFNKTVLEVGCAEGGFPDYLQQLNIKTVGIELEDHRLEIGKKKNSQLELYAGNITDSNLHKQIGKTFDIIVMRDVIEHVPDRKSTFQNIWDFLNPGGYFFITFPPKFSPFAGHQQHAQSFLRYTPWVTFLPKPIWYSTGKMLGEDRNFLDSVRRNFRHGLSIRKFEKIFQAQGFQPVLKEVYLLRPIFKFRLSTPIIRLPNITFLREFFATGCEYLLMKPKVGAE